MMELLSLHLKSEGVYISRMLSYENCEFATIEVGPALCLPKSSAVVTQRPHPQSGVEGKRVGDALENFQLHQALCESLLESGGATGLSEDAVSQERLDLYDAAAVLWQQIFEELVEAYRCGRLDFSEHPHTEEKANRKGAGMYMLQLIFHISHHNLLRLDSCVLHIT